MPWFVDKQNCVIKGTPESPGEKVKCHGTRGEALDHLKALFANVEDIKELIPDALYTFKQDDESRFVAIATIAKIDIDGEEFTKEAQDFAIQAAQKEMPQLRVFHVKGMKVGDADKADRFGNSLVFEGKFDDTPQAKEINRLVDDPDSGLKDVSAGFSVVEATGVCPCGARLMVGPVGLKMLFKCPKCGEIYKGSALSGVKFTKAKIFDITITDRPAVRGTAIASFIVQKETIMTRKELKERLVSNGFDEAIADTWLKSIPDEDLERMKEENVVELFKEAMAEAAKEAEKEGDGKKREEKDPMPIEFKGGAGRCPGCGQRLRMSGGETKETGDIEIDFAPLQDMIKETVAEQFKDIEIELPDLDGRFETIETAIKDLKASVEKQVEDAAAEMLKDASPATKSRLTFRMRNKEQEREEQETTKEPVTGTGIKDADGNEFASMSAMFGEEE